MKNLLFLLAMPFFLQGQSLDQQLFDQYETYKESTIKNRRFKHKDIQVLLDNLRTDAQFKIRHLGKSIEGRDISLVSIGNGPINVLLWSQMHGDEPTATMAIMDIFNFFSYEGRFKDFKALLKDKLTLHFIPMLNPDGAEKFKRRNALGIDLNRDALRLQCPESQILKQIRDELDADWGFNLHDQNRYYAAGINPKTASISFLAPAYNYEKEVNTVRGNAMKMIGLMNNVLQKHIPGKVAKYNDDFEPRAFGDNIQKWGTSTILIESGGLKDDREKQFLRKLHFVMLLSSFQSIANQSFEKVKLNDYEKIPFNDSNGFHDLIIRNANVKKLNQDFIIDIGIRYNEEDYRDHQQYYFESNIRDIGDLSTTHGYEEFDATAYQIVPGKLYPEVVRDLSKLKQMDLFNLVKKGYTNFQLKELPPTWITAELAIALSSKGVEKSNQIALGNNPSLLFQKNGKVHAILVNGCIYELGEGDKLTRIK